MPPRLGSALSTTLQFVLCCSGSKGPCPAKKKGLLKHSGSRSGYMYLNTQVTARDHAPKVH